MEYEIDDDPQGLPERSIAKRDGGVNDKGFFFRSHDPREDDEAFDDIENDDEKVDQFGEAA